MSFKHTSPIRRISSSTPPGSQRSSPVPLSNHHPYDNHTPKLTSPRRLQRLRYQRRSGLLGCLIGISLFFLYHSTLPSRIRQVVPPPNNNNNNNNAIVVHVIQTRWMQHQPHLPHLAAARLRLFESFTLPSLQQQTSRDFLWLIRMDPQLDVRLQSDFLQTLQNTSNVVVLKSNDNPEGFRFVLHDPSQHVYGNWSLLQEYEQTAVTHTVLETRLDADDALALEFVQVLHDKVKHATTVDVPVNNNNNTEHPQQYFRIFCVDAHVEWQHTNPWTYDPRGGLLGLRTHHCVTAGLSIAYPVGMSRQSLNISTKHHHVHQQVPRCRQNAHQPCLERIRLEGDLPVALRARTVTSAGMSSLVLAQGNISSGNQISKVVAHSAWKHQQDALWQRLPRWFGVTEHNVRTMRQAIEDDLTNVLLDALAGQCTEGHSCKESAKTMLQGMMVNHTTTAIQ